MKTLLRIAARAAIDRCLPPMLALTLLCCVSTAATAAPDDNIPVQATLFNYSDGEEVGSHSWSPCHDLGKVLVGIRVITEAGHSRQYRCAEVELNGKTPAFTAEKFSPLLKYTEEDPFIGPERHLIKKMFMPYMTEGPHQPVELRIQAEWALLTVDDHQLSVRPDTTWRNIDEKSRWMACPADMVFIATKYFKFVCGTLWSGNAPSSSPPGRISFRKTEEEWTNCSIGVPNGPVGEVWTAFFDGFFSTCKENIHEGIALQNMPSATRILLTDDRLCSKEPDPDSNDFWIELRITRAKTSMDFLPFDEFFTYDKKSIVRPGVQLMDYYRDGDTSASNKLSCVQVSTSSAPPSS